MGMLVLSRKLGEKIWIGDDVCVTVVDIDRGKIRLGIEAPKQVPIYRQELLSTSRLGNATDQSKQATASPTPPVSEGSTSAPM